MPAVFRMMSMFTWASEGSSASVYVYRDTGFGAASVDFNTSDGTATSADYVPLSTTLNFPDGVQGISANVSIIHDFLPESTESFGVTISNPSSGWSVDPMYATGSVMINDQDHAPVANDDSYSVVHDQTATGNVLTNDTDADGDPLTASLVSGPAHAASFSLGANGAFSYTPTEHWTGTDQFTYAATDGGLPDQAVAVIAVTNQAPTIQPISNQNSIEGRTVSLQINASDPESDPITIAAQGLPAGLSIDAGGLISGKLSYSSSGNANVTITATDNLGAASTRTFVWAVADASIGTLSAIEMSGGTALPNSLTVNGISNSDFWVCPGNSISLVVLPPVGGGELPLLDDILFRVDGLTPSPSSGDFSPEPLVNLPGFGVGYFVHVGIDLDGNGVLNLATEETHSLTARTISFDNTVATAQRTSQPVEGALYPIKYGEHFEVGGSFRFELTGGQLGGPLIRYQLRRRSNGVVEHVATGSGWSFVQNLTGAGEYEVWFWADANNNGGIESELWHASVPFEVKNKKVYNVTYQISNSVAIPPAFAATVPGLFTGAQNALLRKDSGDDWRAAVQINANAATPPTFTPGEARPDPAPTRPDAELHWNAGPNVVFLNSIDGPTFGWSQGSGTMKIIVAYDRNQGNLPVLATSFETTIAHEMGHGVGLEHPIPNDATNAARVMTSVESGPANELTEMEANTFDS